MVNAWQKRLCIGLLISLLLSVVMAEAASDPDREVIQSVELKVANRPIIEFRATILGNTPEARVASARREIVEMLDSTPELEVSLQPIQNSFIVLLGGQRAFIVAPKDVDPLQHDSVEAAAKQAAENLRLVVSESEQSRSLNFMLWALLQAAVATVVFLLLVRLMYFIRSKLLEKLPNLMTRHSNALKMGSTQVVDAYQLFPVLARVLSAVHWLIVLLLTYTWLSNVLSQFPYTRVWGESLNGYLLGILTYVLGGILSALPELGVAVAIFFIARGTSAFVQRLIQRMAASRDGIPWLNKQTLEPTRRLSAFAIWLFALAMAYPYLPGADTDAFKGLSVLLGLMVSLGASSVIGQAASGLILTYSGTLRPGEYVRIGEHEGTVSEMGMFTTRIRTGLGEVLTIPNSMITGTITKNYSRSVQGEGYVVDTTVTIGYDTPWRQVEAMLIEAARRTEGILPNPAPQVFQTALSDYYPEYRLVAQALPAQPRPRAALLSTLHANIQDVFNEYGVQIMSPHYIADPQDAKLVPEPNWYAEPARKE